MAHYLRTSPDFNPARYVKIVHTETVDTYTVYNIELSFGVFHWVTKHRYNEFRELHDKLVAKRGIEKNLLPPKKIFGNNSESFIRKRQGELELYLQTLLYKLKIVPPELGLFLEFDKYEIHGITQVLAEELFHKGDLIKQSGEMYHVTPLQMYAITNRLKLPEPTCESGDIQKDIGHLLDFITTITSIKIVGKRDQFGSSNILMNDLNFDLNMLKSLISLELVLCNPSMLSAADGLKKMLKKLKVFGSMLAIKDILMMDVGFGQWLGTEEESVLVPVWAALTLVDFSYNGLQSIDESVKLMPRVEQLDLSHNSLTDISHLQHLSSLVHLDLSFNHIQSLHDLHMKLGNVKTLILTHNKLESLQGFSKMYSLETLDLSNNEISQVIEIHHISKLPCLENLRLTHNPVVIVVDYRTRILEFFADRAKEITLDGVQAAQKELDTVAVLLALQKSKNMCEKMKRSRKAREVMIEEPHGSRQQRGMGHHSQSLPNFRTDVTQQPTRSQSPLSTQSGYAHSIVSVDSVEHSESLTGNNQVTTSETSAAPGLSARPRTSGIEHHSAGLDVSYVQPLLGYQLRPDLIRTETMVALSGVMLPETLPGRTDSTFLSHLHELLPNTTALSRRSQTRDDHYGEQQEERTIHIMWCTAVCYTKPLRVIMVCVCITTQNVHILDVANLKGGDNGMPKLEHIYCIPLVNIQQIVLGFQRQYFRIEEAFVGPQGTYSLLTGSMTKTDAFLDALKLAYRRAISDIDQYEDPHILASCETELELRRMLNSIEGLIRMEDITISLFMLVNAVDYLQPRQPFIAHSLVMTAKYLYLLKQDYVMWPQATFAIALPSRNQFEITGAFPIMGKITGIQMYDSDTYSPDQETSLAQNFSATNTCSNIVPNFIGYGVKLTFDMGTHGTQTIDIRVPTSGMRDRFLATFTQLRKDNSEKMSSSPKIRTRMKLRDIDSDSLSTNSGGSCHGVKPKYHRTPTGSKIKHKYRSYNDRKQDRVSGCRPNSFSDPIKSDHVKITTASKVAPNPLQLSSEALRDDSNEENEAPLDLLEREAPIGQSGNSADSSSSDSVGRYIADFATSDHARCSEDLEIHISVEDSNFARSPPEDGIEAIEEPSESESNVITVYYFEETVAEEFGNKLSEEKDARVEKSNEERYDDDDDRGIKEQCDGSPYSVTPGHQAEMAPIVKPSILRSQLSLDTRYPSLHLLSHLTECNEQIQLLQPLSETMRTLSAMEGDEILNYFHSCVAGIGQSTEELCHILWTGVLLYTQPSQELVSSVMISTHAIYVMSDRDPKCTLSKNKEWKTHSRNKSDSFGMIVPEQSPSEDMHLSAGVVHQCQKLSGKIHKIPKIIRVLSLKDLKQVSVGLFDQSFRLVGLSPELTFTCMTRDNRLTTEFIKNLTSVLAMVNPTPSPEYPSGDCGTEPDFYAMFNDYSRLESQEFKHPSKVRFIYPNEDVVGELLYVISQNEIVCKQQTIHLLMYLTGFMQNMADVNRPKLYFSPIPETSPGNENKQYIGEPVTLIITELFLTLCQEDHVHYPIPDFARGPPQNTRLHIIENRPLKCLKKIVTSASCPNEMALIFCQDPGIVVNPDFNHYTSYGGRVRKHVTPTPEVKLLFSVQNLTHMEKFIRLLRKQWAEINTSESELDVISRDPQ